MSASAAMAAFAAACGPALAPEPGGSSSGGPTGSGQPIKLGFIALTDCASIVMAQELVLFKQYGLNVEVVKQASWAATRVNLLTGDIDGAHCLFGMPFSVYTGAGGAAGKELHIAMVLNNNGQARRLKPAASWITTGFSPW